ncbi:hypothetical protein CONPUDRAFT_161974 [Coniophora puteana RWD-64-598 SS2]|uniref:Oxidase ustYa n=1 Tax=Coniophora puteana (strain RWD-64-598) TaxID=741705 RepID=A0A5M3N7N5_CONPW|nr:uncharacterized protein CONPUDRAFT_161974 [Coniophora puteana RWD-64-598 SS2]EIW87443.1 hypothetical protein CONPUDRAFT_161974 [Coniophora puteana RWD-64-598 SS2]
MLLWLLRSSKTDPIGCTLLVILTIFNLASLQAVQTALRGPQYWSDYPNEVPFPFHKASLEFKIHESYGVHESSNWATIIPRGRHGWVRLGPQGRPFAVSMYHQMHCINAIRRAVIVAQDPALIGTLRAQGEFKHAEHCFDYLRQTVTCNADTSLEVLGNWTLLDGSVVEGTSSDGILHECRDWTQVRRYVMDNYAEWEDDPWPIREF